MTKDEYKAALGKLIPRTRELVEWAVENRHVSMRDLLQYTEQEFIRWARQTGGDEAMQLAVGDAG